MSARSRSVLVILVMLALVLCCCVTTLLGAGTAWFILATPAERQGGSYGAPEPEHWEEEAPVWFDLRVEGATLVRSAEPVRAEARYRNVGWMIFSDGKLMLHRNATNETRYDLHDCVPDARITAHVTVWSDGAYRRASDEVAIDCRKHHNHTWRSATQPGRRRTACYPALAGVRAQPPL